MTHAGLHALGGIFDQPFDFLGRLRAALRQRTHLARHHRETLALLARAGRLDGGVQGQDVGLKGNAVHHAHDFTDAARAVGNALHALHNLVHRTPAALGQLRGAFRLAAGQIGVARRKLDGVGQLRHVGGGFLQGPGLARGAVGHIRAACRDLAGAGVNFLDTMAHRGHRRRQPRLHAAHG
ncbi:hypothetical protein D3C71_1145160 [compost metagenome]